MRVGSVVEAGNGARQRIRVGIVSLQVRRPGRLRRLVQPGLLGRLRLRRVDIGYSARSEYVVEGRITLADHDAFTNLDGFINLDAFGVVRLGERLYRLQRRSEYEGGALCGRVGVVDQVERLFSRLLGRRLRTALPALAASAARSRHRI